MESFVKIHEVAADIVDSVLGFDRTVFVPWYAADRNRR